MTNLLEYSNNINNIDCELFNMTDTRKLLQYRHLIPKSIVAVLILLSLTLFQAGNFNTLHVHVLSDGRVVVHSHTLPDSGPSKSSRSHTHSHKDFVYVAAINKLLHKSIFLLPAVYSVTYIFDGIVSIAPICYHNYDIGLLDRGRSPPSQFRLFS